MTRFIPIILISLLAQAAETPTAPQADAGQRTTYVLGQDDQVSVRILSVPEVMDKPMRIEADGYIKLPMVGRVKAAGLTPVQLEAEVAKQFSVFLNNPDVSVTVAEYRSQPVSVVGDVNTPGVHQVQAKKTLIEVLAQAGGVRPEAGPMVRITRALENGRLPLPGAIDDPTGRFSQAELNLPMLLGGRTPEYNITIRPNDVISVPRAEVVYVLGEVGHPGSLTLHDGQSISVLQALSASGGLARTAAAQNIKILRQIMGGPKRAELTIDVKKMMAGKANDQPLLAGDILIVPGSSSKKASIRALEAAVTMGTMAATYGVIR